MDDKTFELLTKMYSEFTNKIDGLENNIDGLQNNLKEFRKETNERLIKIETTIENVIKPDIKASLEGYQIVYENQKDQAKQLESIDSKLEKQEVEITVIKGGKKKKVK